MAETQNDPLLPGYSFNAHLVTGLTPIEAQGYLDFFIDRPLGMKGYILNLTIRGEGVINNHGEQFVCVRQIVIHLDHFTGEITYGTSARRCTDTGPAKV